MSPAITEGIQAPDGVEENISAVFVDGVHTRGVARHQGVVDLDVRPSRLRPDAGRLPLIVPGRNSSDARRPITCGARRRILRQQKLPGSG